MIRWRDVEALSVVCGPETAEILKALKCQVPVAVVGDMREGCIVVTQAAPVRSIDVTIGFSEPTT